MLKRYLSIPFSFYCITEDSKGLEPEIQWIEPPEVLEGWWNKLYLFSDIIPKGKTLYLDLDQVIVNDLTPVIEEAFNHPFSCYGDHIAWEGCKFGSSFMLFHAHAHLDIFELFWPQRHGLVNYKGGDQVWINQTGLLPDVFYLDEHFPGSFLSYKWDFLQNGLTDRARIVNCHGFPKPHHVKLTRFMREYWI